MSAVTAAEILIGAVLLVLVLRRFVSFKMNVTVERVDLGRRPPPERSPHALPDRPAGAPPRPGEDEAVTVAVARRTRRTLRHSKGYGEPPPGPAGDRLAALLALGVESVDADGRRVEAVLAPGKRDAALIDRVVAELNGLADALER